MATHTRRHILGVFSGLWGANAAAQDRVTFTTDVRVTNVLATVTNKRGEIVRDLNKDAFLLEEDGRLQVVRYFSRETDLPLTLGLMVDTSMSQRRVLEQERSAAYRFFERVLRPSQDLAFVIRFDFEVELLQDLTAERAKLEKALGLLQVPSQNRMRMPPAQGQRRVGTALHDSVLLACDELMKKQSGRKALVMLSDGVDAGSKVTLASAIESAQRADTLVYSVLFVDPSSYQMPVRRGRRGGGRGPVRQRPDGKKVLQRLATETGGGFFEVSKKLPVEKVFDRIQDELRQQYSLGYVSDAVERTDSYRRIKVATRDKSLVVRAREGYYPR